MKLFSWRMFLPFTLVALLALVVAAARPAQAATCTWTGSSSSAWENPNNWSGCSGLIPSGGDDVIIPDLSDDPVVALTRSVNSIELQSGASLSINSGVTLSVGSMNLYGTLTGDGDLELAGQLDWRSGSTMSGGGKTVIAETGTLSLIEAGGVNLTGRVIENSGEFIWTAGVSGPSIFAAGGALFHNMSAGSVSVTAVASNLAFQDTANSCSFVNDGFFTVSTGNTNGLIMETTFQNDGDVSVSGDGALRLTFGATHSGAFLVNEPAFIFFGDTSYPGENFTFSSSSSLSGWQVRLDRVGTVNVNGGFSAGGSGSGLSIIGQQGGGTTVNFNPGAQVTSLGETVTLQYTALNLNVGGSLSIQTLSQLLSTVSGNTDIAISRQHTWSSGTLTGSGDFTLQTTATGNWGGNQTLYLDGRTITNRGTANWRANSDIQLSNDAVFDNIGTLNAQGDDALSGGTAGTLNNYGLLRKSAGSQTSTIGVAFTNAGDIEADSGQFAFTLADVTIPAGQSLDLGGGTLAPQSLVDLNGGTLLGSGVIAGDLRNNGAVSPGNSPGDIGVSGDYTQTVTGTLAIELGQFGQDNMVITGTATLAGTLNVNFLDAGDDGPPLGMEIWLLRYGDHSGTFTTVNLPEMIGKDWELSYEANGLKATVVEGDFFIYIPIVLNQP